MKCESNNNNLKQIRDDAGLRSFDPRKLDQHPMNSGCKRSANCQLLPSQELVRTPDTMWAGFVHALKITSGLKIKLTLDNTLAW